MRQRLSQVTAIFLLLPVLVVAGLLASFLTFGFVIDAFGSDLHAYLASAMVSATLGAIVCAVLWGFGYIRSWPSLLGSIAAVVAAHWVLQLLDPHLPQQTMPCWSCTSTSLYTPEVAVRFFIVSCIVLLAVLALVEPRAKLHWVLLFSLGGAALGARAMGVCDAWALRTHNDLVVNGRPLEILWQVALAVLVGLAAWAARLVGPLPERGSISEVTELRPYMRWLAPLLLGAMPVVVFGFISHRRNAASKRETDWVTSHIAQSLREAPAPEKLADGYTQPMEQVMQTSGLDDWKMYFSRANRESGEVNGSVAPAISAPLDYSKLALARAALPERVEYMARFSQDNYPYPVTATITQFPNAAWASYELRNQGNPNSFFLHPDEIDHIKQGGNLLFEYGTDWFWSSGDKLVVLNFSGTLPTDRKRFLDSFLSKYPSSIQPSDELEQLAAPH